MRWTLHVTRAQLFSFRKSSSEEGGRGELPLLGKTQARNPTNRQEVGWTQAVNGVGAWLYGPHARVAWGEEREPASSEPVKPELRP